MESNNSKLLKFPFVVLISNSIIQTNPVAASIFQTNKMLAKEYYELIMVTLNVKILKIKFTAWFDNMWIDWNKSYWIDSANRERMLWDYGTDTDVASEYELSVSNSVRLINECFRSKWIEVHCSWFVVPFQNSISFICRSRKLTLYRLSNTSTNFK